jgi:chaperone modulatory protein CbpM
MVTSKGPDIAVPPDEELALSLADLAELSGLGAPLIQELSEAGLLEVTGSTLGGGTYTARSLTVARRARRLRIDFALDEAGTVLALTLFERIETLEARLRELECRLLK